MVGAALAAGAPAEVATAETLKRNVVESEATRIWSATANPDGAGLLERGSEYQPTAVDNFEAVVVDALVRLSRLAESIADELRDCPEQRVRRSAAVLAARAHPVLAAFDGR